MRTALSSFILACSLTGLGGCAPVDVQSEDPGSSSNLGNDAAFPEDNFYASNYADAWKTGIIGLSVAKSSGL